MVMPILQAEIPHFPDDSEFSAFAVEVSHHVRQKVMAQLRITGERNVIIPVRLRRSSSTLRTTTRNRLPFWTHIYF